MEEKENIILDDFIAQLNRNIRDIFDMFSENDTRTFSKSYIDTYYVNIKSNRPVNINRLLNIIEDNNLEFFSYILQKKISENKDYHGLFIKEFNESQLKTYFTEFERFVLDTNDISYEQLYSIDNNWLGNIVLHTDFNVDDYANIANFKYSDIIIQLFNDYNIEGHNDPYLMNLLNNAVTFDETKECVLKRLTSLFKRWASVCVNQLIFDIETEVYNNPDTLVMCKILCYLLDVYSSGHYDKMLNALETGVNDYYMFISLKKKMLDSSLKVLQDGVNAMLGINNNDSISQLIFGQNSGFESGIDEFLKLIDLHTQLSEVYQNILKDEKLNDRLLQFFKSVIDNSEYTNAILESYCTYLINNPTSLDSENVDFVLEVINTKNYTSNSHIRAKFLDFIVNHSTTFKQFDKDLTVPCINFFNDMEFNKDDSMDMEKHFIRTDVYKYFYVNGIDGDKVSEMNEYKIKMFINFVVRDLIHRMNILNEGIEKYIKNTFSNFTIIQKNISNLNEVCTGIKKGVNVLYRFCKLNTVQNSFTSPEILIRFRSYVNVICELYNKYKIDEKHKRVLEYIESLVYTKIDIDSVALDSVNLITLYKDDEDVMGKFFSDGGIDKDTFSKVVEHMSTKYDIDKIDTSKYDEDNLEITDVPDEFLDSIMLSVLKNPVEIPDVKDVIVNRDTAYQCIMNDGVNPYTQQKLTIEELEDYNKRDDVKQRISDLMNRFEEFKNKKKL